MSAWQVAVDQQTCLGSGMCAGSLPMRFRLDGRRASVIGDGVVDPDEDLLDAAHACPAEAITVRDGSTGDLLAPL